MSRKNFFIPIVVAVISIAFVIVSLLVFITRGKPSLIKKKLKIGALILSLTAMFVAYSGCSSNEPRILCYKADINKTYIKFSEEYYSDDGSINIDLKINNIVSGQIIQIGMYSTYYSFKITNENEDEKQTENITALDGSFDEEKEEIEIIINKDLPTGKYLLYLYPKDIEGQKSNPDYYVSSYSLNITNE